MTGWRSIPLLTYLSFAVVMWAAASIITVHAYTTSGVPIFASVTVRSRPK